VNSTEETIARLKATIADLQSAMAAMRGNIGTLQETIRDLQVSRGMIPSDRLPTRPVEPSRVSNSSVPPPPPPPKLNLPTPPVFIPAPPPEEQYKETLKAIESGDEKAKTKLACYKLSGFGGCDVNVDEAITLLKKRVEEKDTDAMWILGLCYEFGKGCKQDLQEAVSLYKQSSDGGNEKGRLIYMNDIGGRGTGVMIMRGSKPEFVREILVVAPWRELNLRTNRIDDVGAGTVSEFLKYNTTLTKLNLGDNKIGDDGAGLLSEVLIKNSTVTELNLEENNVKHLGKMLGDLLKVNTTLKILNLRNNHIGREGGISLCDSLKKNSTLTTLNLTKIEMNYSYKALLQKKIMIITSILKPSNMFITPIILDIVQ